MTYQNVCKLTVCWLTMVLSSAASAGFADILASEDFSYADGPLGGANAGSGWTYAWNANALSMSVVGGEAITTSPGNPPLYGVRGFNNTEATKDLFVAFDIQVNSFSLIDSFGANTSVGVNNPQLSFGKSMGGTEWSIGPSGSVSSGIEVVANTKYRLISAYHSETIGNDFLMLWVNPTADDFFDPETLLNSADAFVFQGVFGASFDLQIFASQPGVSFDNIVISNDPLSVGLRSSAIPEPSLTAVIAIGILLTTTHRFSRRCEKRP